MGVFCVPQDSHQGVFCAIGGKSFGKDESDYNPLKTKKRKIYTVITNIYLYMLFLP